jgi:DNA-binding transcriptional MerR regulator
MSSNPQQSQHPNKLFYRIGEVSRLTGLEPYVLRYWETEFPQIKPGKGSRSAQRLYTKKDLDSILLIKQLLYKDGYTIAGARKKLNGRAEQNVEAIIETAKKDLKDILEILK